MRTSFVAVTLCALLVGTVAAAGAVSAKNNDNTINSSIRQYDVMYYPPDSKTGEVIGKVTIDGETGHYVAM